MNKQYSMWSVNIYLTFIFINLFGIVETYNKKNSGIATLLDNIEIDKYIRYKNRSVDSFYKMLEHYRDAVCHSEESASSKINKTTAGNVKFVLQFNGGKIIISHGEGRLYYKEHLKFFIKQIRKLILPNEMDIVSIQDENGNELFFDLSFYDMDLPITSKFDVKLMGQGIFNVYHYFS
jgi:hypothetical protein